MGVGYLRPLRAVQHVYRRESGEMKDKPESVRRFWTTTFHQAYQLEYETAIEGHLLQGAEPYQVTLLTPSDVDGQTLPFKDGDFVGSVEVCELVNLGPIFPGCSQSSLVHFTLKMNKDHLAACDGLEDFKVSLGRGSVRATVDSDKEISNVTVGPETVSVGTDNVTSFVVVYRVQAVGRVPPDSKVQVHISVLVQRTYSQCEKVLIEVQQSPDWKLLCEVDRFGDVDLIGQVTFFL